MFAPSLPSAAWRLVARASMPDRVRHASAGSPTMRALKARLSTRLFAADWVRHASAAARTADALQSERFRHVQYFLALWLGITAAACGAKAWRSGAVEEDEDPDSIYAEQEYWDARYEASQATDPVYDWFSHCAPVVAKLIEEHLDVRRKEGLHGTGKQPPRLLMLGCGNSELSWRLAEDHGLTAIVNIDYSSLVIEQMVAASAKRGTQAVAAMQWRVADVTDMQDALPAGESIDVVIDKSTLDAVHCGPGGKERAVQTLRECDRVLVGAGRGLFICLCGTAAAGTLHEVGQGQLGWNIARVETKARFGDFFHAQGVWLLPEIFVCRKP